jgi:hypothetical protein
MESSWNISLIAIILNLQIDLVCTAGLCGSSPKAATGTAFHAKRLSAP